MVFQVTAELQVMPLDNSAQHLNTQIVLFVFSTLLYFHVFCMSAEVTLSFLFFWRNLWQDWQRNAP